MNYKRKRIITFLNEPILLINNNYYTLNDKVLIKPIKNSYYKHYYSIEKITKTILTGLPYYKEQYYYKTKIIGYFWKVERCNYRTNKAGKRRTKHYKNIVGYKGINTFLNINIGFHESQKTIVLSAIRLILLKNCELWENI